MIWATIFFGDPVKRHLTHLCYRLEHSSFVPVLIFRTLDIKIPLGRNAMIVGSSSELNENKIYRRTPCSTFINLMMIPSSFLSRTHVFFYGHETLSNRQGMTDAFMNNKTSNNKHKFAFKVLPTMPFKMCSRILPPSHIAPRMKAADDDAKLNDTEENTILRDVRDKNLPTENFLNDLFDSSEERHPQKSVWGWESGPFKSQLQDQPGQLNILENALDFFHNLLRPFQQLGSFSNAYSLNTPVDFADVAKRIQNIVENKINEGAVSSDHGRQLINKAALAWKDSESSWILMTKGKPWWDFWDGKRTDSSDISDDKSSKTDSIWNLEKLYEVPWMSDELKRELVEETMFNILVSMGVIPPPQEQEQFNALIREGQSIPFDFNLALILAGYSFDAYNSNPRGAYRLDVIRSGSCSPLQETVTPQRSSPRQGHQNDSPQDDVNDIANDGLEILLGPEQIVYQPVSIGLYSQYVIKKLFAGLFVIGVDRVTLNTEQRSKVRSKGIKSGFQFNFDSKQDSLDITSLAGLEYFSIRLGRVLKRGFKTQKTNGILYCPMLPSERGQCIQIGFGSRDSSSTENPQEIILGTHINASCYIKFSDPNEFEKRTKKILPLFSTDRKEIGRVKIHIQHISFENYVEMDDSEEEDEESDIVNSFSMDDVEREEPIIEQGNLLSPRYVKLLRDVEVRQWDVLREAAALSVKEKSLERITHSTDRILKGSTERVGFVHNQDTDTVFIIRRAKTHEKTVYIVAFRGTEQSSWKNLLTDSLAFYYPFDVENVNLDILAATEVSRATNFENRPAVHYGFLRSYASIRHVLISMLSLVTKDCENNVSIFFCGHSLGGGLATLAALDAKKSIPNIDVQMYNFGSPKVGNGEFVRLYNATVPSSYRIVNDADLFPRVPRGNYQHVGRTILINTAGEIWEEDFSGKDLLGTRWTNLNDLIAAESSLLSALIEGRSFAHHMEDAYFKSVVAASMKLLGISDEEDSEKSSQVEKHVGGVEWDDNTRFVNLVDI